MAEMSVRRALRRVAACALVAWCASAAAQMQMPGAFAVNETGAATYTIPISVPPGVGGVEPKLELVYNSQRGNGPLGMGWALSGLSAITRCPQTLAQDGVRGAVNFDGGDRFCIDGQRLMVVSGVYGNKSSVYRTELESYKKVIQAGPAVAGDPTGPILFAVVTKDGFNMLYGGTDDSRVRVNGNVANLAWLLSSVTDRLGNRYDITYVNEISNGVAYPTRIDYTSNSGTGLTATSSVLFDYEVRGMESPPVLYHAGGPFGSYLVRLAKVRTVTDAGARPVLEYRLGYGNSPSTGRSRIETITLCTAAGVCLPATTFAWAPPESDTYITNAAVPSFATASAVKTLMGDFNGDGRTDLLFHNLGFGNTPVLYANGDGTWRQDSMSTLPGLNCCNLEQNPYNFKLEQLTSSVVVEGDFSGDGRQDVVAIVTKKNPRGLEDGDPTRPLYFLSSTLQLHRSGGEAAWTSTSGSLDFGSEYFKLMKLHVGDFDGDGRADLLFRSSGAAEFYVLFSNGDGTWRQSKSTLPSNITDWVNNADSAVFVGDFNGDGKHDLTVRNRNFTTQPVFFSKGDGTWTVTNAATPDWANGTLVGSLELGDYNGDGKTDLMLRKTDSLSILYATGNGEWHPLVSTLSAEAKQAMTTGYCGVGDFNADGRHDIAYGCGSGTTLSWFYSMGNGNWRIGTAPRPNVALGAGRRLTGDFDADGVADVMFLAFGAPSIPLLFGRIDNGERLRTITQGNGSVTQVEITSLVQSGNYTTGEVVAAPYVVTTPAMRVVRRSLEDTGTADKTVMYSYDSAILELGTGRGFAGFGTVTARDDDVDTSTFTKYRYDWPYTGRLKSRIVLQGLNNSGTAPAILSSTAVQFTCQNPVTAPATVAPGTGGAAFAPGQPGNCTVTPGGRYQVWASRTAEGRQDLNRTSLPGQRTDVSDMDKFGNPGRVRVETLNPDGTASGNIKVTDTWYSNDEALWVLGLPIRSNVTVTKP